MDINLLAGKPADPASLVNVTKLVNAYYTEMPDPSVPGQRVLFGTSRHFSEPIRKLLTANPRQTLARYAVLVTGPVPIVESEVLMDGGGSYYDNGGSSANRFQPALKAGMILKI